MFTSSARHGASMPTSSTAGTELKHVKAALSRPSGAFLDANLGRQSVPYVHGTTISKRVRETGMKKIGLCLNSTCRRENIFTHNASDALDLLEGALSKAIDYYVTATTTTDDEYKSLTAVVEAELDNMKNKQAFFVLIEHFVSNVSNATGVPVPAVIVAAKKNATSASNSGSTQTKISSSYIDFTLNNGSTANAAAASELSDMDIDPDGAPGVQSNSAPGPNVSSSSAIITRFDGTIQQPPSVANEKLRPRQGSQSYLDGIGYEFHYKGLEYLHSQVEAMHRQFSPPNGILLDNDGLHELTHDLDAKILRNIHAEAQSLLGSPSETWLKQKYKNGVEIEYIALGEQSNFLAGIKCILDIRDVEMAGIPAHDNSTDPPLTQEELNAIQPLSVPPPLLNFPHGKRVQISSNMFRIVKRTNNEATARFKERLQPSEMARMVQQEELAVLQCVADSMKDLSYTPDDAEIEKAYDTQSEFEFQNCSKLDLFVGKVKTFTGA